MRLILAGAGHAHLGVLRHLAARPWPGGEVRLVNPVPLATYSGMVPGWLAGRYHWNELNIDIATLAARAGVRLELARIVRIHADTRQIELEGGRRLDYDLLSLNLGSAIRRPPGAAGLSIRPLQDFYTRWSAWCAEAVHLPAGAKREVAVVGAGAAGIEVLLAVRHRLCRVAPQVSWQWRLLDRSARLLSGWSAGARRRVLATLKRHHIHLKLGMDTFGIAQGAPSSIQNHAPDLLIWCSGAAAPELLRDSHLALNAEGFVRIDATLRCTSHATVFAAGDCAAFPQPIPKSGVHAVRQGPVLADNLRAVHDGQSLRSYRPRRHTLFLLNTADDRAIGQWGPFSAEGAWVMRGKDFIDRRFIEKHRLPPFFSSATKR